MIETVSTTLTALRTAVDMAKAAISVRDDKKVTEATELLQRVIIDVQNSALHLQEKLAAQQDHIQALKDDKRELSAKVAELEKRKAERDQYELHEISPNTFVLAYIKSSDGSTPMHYLCQPCMDNRAEKVVLQPVEQWGSRYAVCTSCKVDYRAS